MNPTPTSPRLRALQLGLTLLALWGFYAGFRLFQDMLRPPIEDFATEDRDGFTPPTASSASQAHTVPRHLPWPKYPGASHLHFGQTDYHLGKTMIQTLESRASPEKITTWYRKQLTRKGWTSRVAKKDVTAGTLSAPLEVLRDNPEAFQHEKVLRMIDAFQSNVVIMRKGQQLIFITAEPSRRTPRRQEVRVVWYEIDPKQEPPRSDYAKKHLGGFLPFDQQFGEDELTTKTVASHLPPTAHLAQWRTHLQREGWEEVYDSKALTQFTRTPNTVAAFFTRGDNGTVVAIQPGPERGSLGLVTRFQ